MLKHTELVLLERELRRSKVLSVYVANEPENPAERTAWRRALSDALNHARDNACSAPHSEREALEASIHALETELTRYPEALPARGWFAFATPDGVRLSDVLPSAPPFVVAWQDGIRIAPYFAAGDKRLGAVIAVVDSRQARLYRLDDDTLEKMDTVRAHTSVGPLEHMGYPPSVGFHTGTRGTTGSDEAQRELLVGRQHMVNEAAERLVDLSSPTGLILVGGIPEVAIATIAALPQTAQHRAHRVPGLDVHAREAEILATASETSLLLRDARDLADVDEVLARWAAAGQALAGAVAIRDALRSGAVSQLFITRAFIADQGLEAEDLVVGALEQGARVVVVHGEAARRLDIEGSGLVAGLRFLPYRIVTTPEHVPTVAPT